MKTQILKTVGAIIIALFTIQIDSSAQNYWQLGGNTNAGPPLSEGLLTNSNYFGSTQTASLQFGTGGNTYMFIGGSIIPVYNGLIGIGNGFVTPAYQVDILGNYVGDGVNVSNYTITPYNAVGV